MKNSWLALCSVACSLAPVATLAAEINLSRSTPVCKMPQGKSLPSKYYVFESKWKEYRWVKKVKNNNSFISEGGYERVDGSSMYNWHTFVKFDITGDGIIVTGKQIGRAHV